MIITDCDSGYKVTAAVLFLYIILFHYLILIFIRKAGFSCQSIHNIRFEIHWIRCAQQIDFFCPGNRCRLYNASRLSSIGQTSRFVQGFRKFLDLNIVKNTALL